MNRVYQNQGQGPITHVVKSLDRFYVAISYSDDSCKDELKIFQHYGYFSSASAAAEL